MVVERSVYLDFYRELLSIFRTKVDDNKWPRSRTKTNRLLDDYSKEWWDIPGDEVNNKTPYASLMIVHGVIGDHKVFYRILLNFGIKKTNQTVYNLSDKETRAMGAAIKFINSELVSKIPWPKELAEAQIQVLEAKYLFPVYLKQKSKDVFSFLKSNGLTTFAKFTHSRETEVNAYFFEEIKIKDQPYIADQRIIERLVILMEGCCQTQLLNTTDQFGTQLNLMPRKILNLADNKFPAKSSNLLFVPSFKYSTKRGKHFQEKLFERFRIEIGYIWLNFSEPNIPEQYERAEIDLYYKIRFQFDQWTLLINKHPHPERIRNNGLEYARQNDKEGCIFSMRFCSTDYLCGRKPVYKQIVLEREFSAIGKIRKIIFEIPEDPILINHYIQFMDTLEEFLIYTYGFLERSFLSLFVGKATHLVDKIHDLLDTEAGYLNLENLSNKAYLTVTELNKQEETHCAYYIPSPIMTRILEKLKLVMDFDFGALELFLKFVSNKFSDAAWKEYKEVLYDGFNVPFDVLSDLHSLHVDVQPILKTERYIHGGNNNEKLYVRILSEYNNCLLELNASGNYRQLFDRVIDRILPVIREQFKRNIDQNLKGD